MNTTFLAIMRNLYSYNIVEGARNHRAERNTVKQKYNGWYVNCTQ